MSDITTNIVQRICDLPPANPEKEDVLIITVPDLRVIQEDEIESLNARVAELEGLLGYVVGAALTAFSILAVFPYFLVGG